MTKQLLRSLVVGVVALTWVMPASAEVIVDDFNTAILPTSPLDAGPLATVNSNPQSGAGITGTRVVTVSNTSNGALTEISAAIGGGQFSGSANANAAGFIALNYTSFGGLPLQGSFLDLFFDSLDFASNPLSVDIEVDGVSQNIMIPDDGNPPALDRAFSFSLGSLFTAANLSSVDQFKLTFNLSANQDILVGNGDGTVVIREIPEPASLALCGMVAVAGVWYSRRRRQAA